MTQQQQALALAAVIFDMDGVLVDSEPMWQRAELAVLPRYGVPLTLADTVATKGLRIDQVVALWYSRHPWQGASIDQVAAEIVDQVAALVRTEGQPLPGVEQAFAVIKANGLPIALATSSPTQLINATLERLQLTEHFQAICSAEALAYGKPHPQVYLNAATALGVAPEQCLAIEDSVNGVIAAKAANMAVVAIPEVAQQQDPRFSIANFNLATLHELNQDWWRQHCC
ncbi:hexitol phosphatase HxpB [Ferrimonas lipolytica]|uniref:Hexitol phosphatase HxpB n=1 Tax=Ferrimonas lipolytica TaxID=2724191 RepID=A0A6H1UIX2_9GAMM|nr:hexitol phosphatase HxpB [Ferrimonas lipolytica]QIZ78560.1 hexitol phosphatase HxpB [Ferrimonas lipolytica]